MNYKLVSFLIAWIFPTKEIRGEFRELCHKSDDVPIINKRKKQFVGLKKSITQKAKEYPLKVFFLVNEIAKWKAQSLYDLMKKSNCFEPIIALTIADVQTKFTLEEKISILNKNKAFFNSKNMKTVLVYDTQKDKSIGLDTLRPDIVFFQQPWSLYENQTPKEISKYALTCYIPYYVLSYGGVIDYNQPFHSFLHKYYILNEEWANIFTKKNKFRLGSILPFGHTALDRFCDKNVDIDSKYVIYAPHWSIMLYNKKIISSAFVIFMVVIHFNLLNCM